jgi:NAD(P)-dependent dehydrogenase (short-subunit alcohol dehydrogenase family)
MSEAKRIVLTGASSGIGAALARWYAGPGVRLALVARRLERLEALARELEASGAEARPLQADVSREPDCRRMIEEAERLLGGIDLLVLNAGVGNGHQRVDEIRDAGVFERLMATNALGPMYCAWHALPALKRSRGQIVVVSSLQGKTGFPGSAPYSASKHAVHGFFDSLRIELAPSGVRVTLVCPGGVDTEIRQRIQGAPPQATAAAMSAEECAARIIRAADAGKRELVMTLPGKLGGLLRPFFPALVDRLVSRGVARYYGR